MCTEHFRWHYDYTRILWDAGFCFNNQKSLKAFDRNGIALLDIERIIRERDTRIVEHHIQNILEYTLDAEEARILDPNFVKLFRLSQLAVEYLNYCKKYLDVTTDTLKQELQKANEENDELKQDIINYEQEVSRLKKKIKDLKSTLHIHQKYQPTGALHGPPGTFRCNECKKGFLNAEYLKKHFRKRHPDSSEIHILETKLENPESNSEINTTPVHSQYKTETDKLQMEIKELKEKLNSTERFFQNKPETVSNAEQAKYENKESKTQSEEYYKHVEELHNQFELLKTQIESEMQLLKSQKIEKDKYEELMEKFFNKLDERHDTVDVAQVNEASASKIVEKALSEKSVETVEDIVHDNDVSEEEVQVQSTQNTDIIKPAEEVKIISPKKPIEIVSESPIEREPVDVEKIKEEVEKDLEEKSKQNIEKLGKQISENIASTFDVLQERLETFWHKLQEIEVDRGKQQQTMVQKPPLQHDREKQRIVIHKTPLQIEREKQRITIQRPPPKIDSVSRKTSDEIIPEIEVQENLNIPSSDDSETESSKNEKIIEIHKSQSVLKSIQKNDKIARNLMAELKTKVEERNSSMYVESRKPQEKQKPVIVEKPKPIVVQKPTVQQIYSKALNKESSSEEETETETETESESESETPVVVKPSKTTTVCSKSQRPTTNTTEGGRSTNTGISTLKNRSITSLENALRTHPNILAQLRDDMNEIVASRLKDLGIDPEWTRIPDKTYKQNFEIVTHHRYMAAKNVTSFMDIRNDILENIEDQVHGLKRRDSRELTTPEPEYRPSRFKSLLQNMREKAKSILKTERAPTPTAPIYKLTIQKHHSSPNVSQSSEKLKEPLKSKSTGAKNAKLKQVASASTMYDTDSDDGTETIARHVTTPVKSRTKSVQSSKKGLRKSRSESSMEVVEFSDQGPEIPKTTSITNLTRSLDSIVEMKKELASQLKKSNEKIYSTSSLDTIDNVKDEVIAVSPRENPESSDTNLIHKIIQAEKCKLDILSSEMDSDDMKEDDKIQKSVLKHVASTSASVKKKVLFDLHSDNTKTETAAEQKLDKTAVKQTIVKSNSLFKTNEWNDSSTSIDSSILDLKKVPKQSKGQGDTISTKAVINVSTKPKKAQEDASDWEISDIN